MVVTPSALKRRRDINKKNFVTGVSSTNRHLGTHLFDRSDPFVLHDGFTVNRGCCCFFDREHNPCRFPAGGRFGGGLVFWCRRSGCILFCDGGFRNFANCTRGRPCSGFFPFGIAIATDPDRCLFDDHRDFVPTAPGKNSRRIILKNLYAVTRTGRQSRLRIDGLHQSVCLSLDLGVGADATKRQSGQRLRRNGPQRELVHRFGRGLCVVPGQGHPHRRILYDERYRHGHNFLAGIVSKEEVGRQFGESGAHVVQREILRLQRRRHRFVPRIVPHLEGDIVLLGRNSTQNRIIERFNTGRGLSKDVLRQLPCSAGIG
mmetsp:Transcript_17298/g.34425  ORF Transcript_17298/g.34425 Transcript_17298/m.34425 type:complete len:317 (-) Transcript_17298:578-1528(-)